jgi:monoamine oxidase
MSDEVFGRMKRRDLFRMIGAVAGGGAMLQAMSGMGYAKESGYTGPIKLPGDPKGTSVVVLGAGWGGLVSALELRNAGYKVTLLEYNERIGGRAWSVRGGDQFTELGGHSQTCGFDKGLYVNVGPWRIPYHHRGYLDYAKRFNVDLEPFIQVNYNAFVHSTQAFGGKPKRYREVQADFHGHVGELLAKSAKAGQLNQSVTKEDAEILMEALKSWGALDDNYRYGKTVEASERRGWDVPPGAGMMPLGVPSEPIELKALLQSGLWQSLANGVNHHWQSTIFQPVGGMDMTPKAIGREIASLIKTNCKVTAIKQDGKSVTVTYVDAKTGGNPQQIKADWCISSIPTTVLSQIDFDCGAPMKAAINALSFASYVKTGLQFKRKFWEEDEQIFGGITFTDLPIRQIAYPNTNYNKPGKGTLLGTFVGRPQIQGYELTGMTPEERIQLALDCGAQIHPQYKTEYENGFSVAWHRVPSHLGCYPSWDDALMAKHYRNLCEIDGRVALVGDQCSELPGWQEGAILSSLDAISRIHKRVVAA